jgi:acyl carrier protein
VEKQVFFVFIEGYRTMVDYSKSIKQFVIENFLFGQDDGIANDTSFLESGILDSTGILELVNHLEQTHNIRINDDELVPENLDSINNINQFLNRKLACAG